MLLINFIRSFLLFSLFVYQVNLADCFKPNQSFSINSANPVVKALQEKYCNFTPVPKLDFCSSVTYVIKQENIDPVKGLIIDKSGVWCLEEDISYTGNAAAINIVASNVYLNLNSHTIDLQNLGLNGVAVTGQGIQIRNGTIINSAKPTAPIQWFFRFPNELVPLQYSAITIDQGSQDVIVDNIVFRLCTFGIRARGTVNRVEVSNCVGWQLGHRLPLPFNTPESIIIGGLFANQNPSDNKSGKGLYIHDCIADSDVHQNIVRAMGWDDILIENVKGRGLFGNRPDTEGTLAILMVNCKFGHIKNLFSDNFQQGIQCWGCTSILVDTAEVINNWDDGIHIQQFGINLSLTPVGVRVLENPNLYLLFRDDLAVTVVLNSIVRNKKSDLNIPTPDSIIGVGIVGGFIHIENCIVIDQDLGFRCRVGFDLVIKNCTAQACRPERGFGGNGEGFSVGALLANANFLLTDNLAIDCRIGFQRDTTPTTKLAALRNVAAYNDTNYTANIPFVVNANTFPACASPWANISVTP